MKKTILIMTLLAFACAVGSARAAEQTSGQPYNGITYFEKALAAPQPETIAAIGEASPYNGVTVFETAGPKPVKESAAAGGSVLLRLFLRDV
jgi:hypothetical protein